jgi:hypothetical protein
MVAVMVMMLVVGALAATMLVRTGGTRRKTRKVTAALQRALVLDAAMVHAYHVLRARDLETRDHLTGVDLPPGEGELAKIPYTYAFIPEPSTNSVRIEATAGKAPRPTLSGYAVAYLKLEEQPGRQVQRWSIRYFGPEEKD